MKHNNSFSKISHDSLSHTFSFLNLEDLIHMKETSKEMEKIVNRYGLINAAYKRRMNSHYPRIEEALRYKEDKNLKINWSELYLKQGDNEFLKHAFAKSVLYQCDNIMISKPLVMGIYNLTFELCTKSREDGQSEWCYNICNNIIQQKAKELKQRLDIYGIGNYQKEKFQFKVMIDWISKSTGYICRYLVPNLGVPTFEEVGERIFTNMIINHFRLTDTYERTNIQVTALRNTELSHVIYSFVDNN